MFYRIGDFLLNLNLNSFRIYQPSASSSCQLYASDIGEGTPVFSGTREECEVILQEIQHIVNPNPDGYVIDSENEVIREVEATPEPEEAEESEDDAADEEE